MRDLQLEVKRLTLGRSYLSVTRELLDAASALRLDRDASLAVLTQKLADIQIQLFRLAALIGIDLVEETRKRWSVVVASGCQDVLPGMEAWGDALETKGP
jgi:predicted exporter